MGAVEEGGKVALLAVALLVTDGAVKPLAESGVSVTEYEPRLLELDVLAVESAYRDYVHDLFTSWMKDPTGQPARATQGAIRARKAFIAAMDGIKRRREQR